MTTAFLFVSLFALMTIGVPISISLGLSAIVTILMFGSDSLGSLAIKFFQAMQESYTLLAIPFFVLAGNLMTTGGVARRMIDFAIACVGHLPGGLAIASVLACMLFAAVSGSSPATVVAVGSIVIAGMVRSGYPLNLASGVICNAGTLGILIPPSIVMVVYAATTETSVGRLFMARVPVSLKVFLTALAILDDLGAVVIIAVFYTADLNVYALLGAICVFGILRSFNALGYQKLMPYLLLGAVLWFLVLKSGVHATLAGVALALTIPIKASPGTPDDAKSPLHRLEHSLHPWVAFIIIPIFGFANAGVSFAGVGPSALLDPVPLGITLGLFIGKQIGVFGFAWAAIRKGLADLPASATWLQLYGVALLCGIGFTMSLFIGLLAFPQSQFLQDETKIGVLVGSVVAGTIGWLILRFAPPEKRLGRPS